MAILLKAKERSVRKSRQTGETFDAPATQKQAAELYPKVMAKLAE